MRGAPDEAPSRPARQAASGMAAMALLSSIAATMAGSALADVAKGSFTYSSARNCARSGKLSSDICAFAEKNSAAEFEEKAPRFAQRAVCEQAYGVRACSIGFRGAEGWSGKKNGVYFSPRQQGFRVTVRSERDMSVVPLGANLGFSSRSALRKDASINPRAIRERTAAGAPGGFGVSAPDGPGGPIPPRPPLDPHFDCAAFLEDGDKGDPSTGCAVAPQRR